MFPLVDQNVGDDGGSLRPDPAIHRGIARRQFLECGPARHGREQGLEFLLPLSEDCLRNH